MFWPKHSAGRVGLNVMNVFRSLLGYMPEDGLNILNVLPTANGENECFLATFSTTFSQKELLRRKGLMNV